YNLALRDFDDALLYLRSNGDINYEQLGLKFKLYSAEVLFNKGPTKIYVGQVDEGFREHQQSTMPSTMPSPRAFTCPSPVGVLYRPAEKKLKNAKKDYMGKAKLVAAEDASQAFTELTGVARMKQSLGLTPDAVSPLTRSATLTNPIPPPSASHLSFTVDKADSVVIHRDGRRIPRPAPPAVHNDHRRLRPPSPPRTGPASAPTPRAGSPFNNPPASAAPLGLSNSSAGRMGGGAGMGPTHGLSIRKPGMQSPGPTSAPAQGGVRTTEIYDSYLDGYAAARAGD
ncbi:uncharacterized protein C8Q71DRAFT_687929, partial [Rhodofomes roseus]